MMMIFPMETLQLMGTVLALVLSAAFLGFVCKWHFFQHYIPGIPIVKANSLFGFNINKKRDGKYNSHVQMLELAEEKGKIVQYYWLGHLWVMVNDKYIAKHVLESVDGKGFFHRNPNINGRNILNLDTGPEWKRRRMAFRQAFTVNNLRHFQKHIKALGERLCRVLSVAAEERSVVQIDRLFGQLAVDVICSVGFQYDMHALETSQQFQNMHKDLRVRFESNDLIFLPVAHMLMKMRFLPTVSGFVAAKKSMTDFSKELLSHLRALQARGELSDECFGHALLEFGEQEGVSDEDLCNEIQIMFIAGHETTAHTISWFVYSLCVHPDVQARCHEALAQHSVSSSSSASTSAHTSSSGGKSDLPPYVEAVLRESMRRYPMLSRGSSRVVREKEGFLLPVDLLNATDPNVLSRHAPFAHDIVLPQGTWCQVYTNNIQTSVDNWGPSGKEFVPERFLAQGHYLGGDQHTEEATRGTSKSSGGGKDTHVNPLSSAGAFSGSGATTKELSFLPFSFGKRNCIGMNLALLEMRVVLLALLREFEFSLADESLREEAVALESVITLRPAKMLPVFVTKR